MGQTSDLQLAGAERSEEQGGSPFSPNDEAYRRALRTFLASQVGFERAQGRRHFLLFVLAAASGITWMMAAWPGLLPSSVRSTLLSVWWLLVAAVLCAALAEYQWRRRSKDARRDLATITLPRAAR